MKKIFTILLALSALGIVLTGCAPKDTATEGDKAPESGTKAPDEAK